MKKLMIALGAVAVAAGVQAASFQWKNTSGAASTKIFQSDGATGVAEDTVAYLFCTTDTTQADLLAAWRKDGASALTTKAISGANGTVNANSKIAQTDAFEYGDVGGDYTFYYALLNGDEMLISATAGAQGQQGATELISFTSSSTWSKADNGTGAYSAAGWYSIPEPTSGLLLLLGMAGLALRRRRAEELNLTR